MAMTNTTPDVESIVEDAYYYGLQQVIFYETRFNYTQNEGSNVYCGINRWTIANDGKPITADFTAVVTPNATTLYATAFLDLQEEPVVIEMPEITDRYFSLQLMSQYGTYFLYAGNQFNGTDARSYLILPRGYDGDVPADFPTTDVVKAPTKTAFANVRYALHDPTDDSEIAHINDLQAKTTITPLSEWVANGHSGVPRSEQPVVPGNYETFPRMRELTSRQVEKQTAEDYFTILNLVLNDPSMPLLGDSLKETEMLEWLDRVGVGAGNQFDWAALDRGTQDRLTAGFKKGFETVKQTGRTKLVDMNGWGVFNISGNFETDWLTRAVMADFGWAGPDWNGSHTAGFAFTDANGEQLHGANRYTITFDLDNLPPVTQFWSIPIYDAQGYFVDNEIDRYSINSFMLEAGLLHVEDDQLVIYVQSDKPDDPDEAKNWLPAPDEAFRFAARFYGPYWSIVDGSYDMPAIVPHME